MPRVPQPPITATLRNVERHDFWPGFIVTVIGVILIVCAGERFTNVDTLEGGTASEFQLVKAFSTGGLQFPGHVSDAQPPKPTGDAAASAAALDRWAKQQDGAAPVTWKVRVNTAAKTPCPT